MPINKELLDILACPIDKKDVEYKESEDFISCKACDIRILADRAKGDACAKCGGEAEKIKGVVPSSGILFEIISAIRDKFLLVSGVISYAISLI